MKIFIAGPLSNADPRQVIRNVWAAMDVANKLIARGREVYCPHLMWYLWRRSRGEVPEQRYAEQALAMVDWCDALVRLPGKSQGADIEEAKARASGKAMYYWDRKRDRGWWGAEEEGLQSEGGSV